MANREFWAVNRFFLPSLCFRERDPFFFTRATDEASPPECSIKKPGMEVDWTYVSSAFEQMASVTIGIDDGGDDDDDDNDVVVVFVVVVVDVVLGFGVTRWRYSDKSW